MQLPYRHGQYVLLEQIACGGMAVIYRGRQVGPEGFTKEVAIKRLLPQWSRDNEFITLLIDEARALMQLQHQNIVQIYELGTDQGIYFLVMEYVPGLDVRTLLDHLRSDQQILPVNLVYFIVMEILKGLSFAHTQRGVDGNPLQIVHRDISPQNILLSLQGEVKIADFGIAKGEHRSIETTGLQVKGKYAYMSPEQAKGEKVDRRTDIFAVGVLLYELLVGEQLFAAPNDMMVLEKVKCVSMPKGWESKIHPAVRVFVRRALALNLQDRYPDAASFLHDLSNFTTEHRLGVNTLELSSYLHKQFPKLTTQVERAGELPMSTELAGAYRTRGYTVAGQRKYKRWAIVALLLVTISSLAGIVRGDIPRPQTRMMVREIPAPELDEKRPIRSLINVVVDPTDQKLQKTKLKRHPPIAKRALSSLDKGTLTVKIRPWGYVTIPGIITRREAPVTVKVPPGDYLLNLAGAGGRRTTIRAKVNSNRYTRCFGTLSDHSGGWCKQ